MKAETLRALKNARDLAMKNTLAARIPECGDFGHIAQDLDYVLNDIEAYTAPPRAVDVDGERYRKLVATGSFTPALNPERTPWGLRMSGTPATKQELDSAVDAMEAK